MIYTFSRDMVETGLDLVEPYALISISTPPAYGPNQEGRLFDEGRHAATLPADEFRLDVLRLAFWDVEDIPQGFQGDNKWLAQVQLYSAEDARRVAAFVRAWKVNIVVHCDAGISRSQGMANAISDHLDAPVRHSTRGMPNRRVYQMTWNALRPDEVGIPKAELAARAFAKTFEAFKPRVQPRLDGKDKYRIRFSEAGE